MALRLRPASDEHLVRRFRSGDDDAFAQIVERYRPRLVRYASGMLRTRGRHAADDVVQDVFVRAFGRLRQTEDPMALRAWLYRIAHNRCLDELSGRVSAELVTEPMSAGGAELEFERGERMRTLVEDIQGLPPQQRSALIIREMDGLTYDEIAAALGVTVPAVKSLLVRARMNLAKAAEARDAGHVPVPARTSLAAAAAR